MKWCITFPDEDILIKRPCLKQACCSNTAAASLLSYFLYRVSISPEYKQSAHSTSTQSRTQESPLRSVQLSRTQRDIVREMDHEISDHTLRDTAIPLLVALGYVSVHTQ